MICIDSINKSYWQGDHEVPVLNDISIDVQKNDFIALTGKSGSGKSTLLNVIGLLDQYDSGTYHFNNELMKGFTETEAASYRNQHVGFVFQSFHLIPGKTALENVELPLLYQNIRKKERKQKAEYFLEKVGLSDRMHHLPNQLSGGQQQRVAIARSLVTEPDLILADEPTGALDSDTSEDIMQLFETIHKEGKTIIIVTHETDIAQRCQRIIHIKDGKILA